VSPGTVNLRRSRLIRRVARCSSGRRQRREDQYAAREHSRDLQKATLGRPGTLAAIGKPA
jgi:hypothetical protein